MNPLARIVYNIVAEGGDDVLRAAGRAAKKIDPKTAKEAVKRVADDVVEATDDWGWKGGKPGEETADVLLKRFNTQDNTDDLLEEVTYLENEVLDRFADKYPQSAYGRFWDMSQNSGSSPYASASAARTLLTNLERAQKADFPREWTGKIVGALTSGDQTMVSADTYRQLSDRLRNLTPSQREDFLALLPEWTESLDDLVNAVRML